MVHSTDGWNGSGSGLANATWTSPINGVVDISGFAWIARDIGRSNNWILSLNASVLSSGSVASGDSYDRANPFQFVNGSGGASVLDDVADLVGDVIKLEIVNTAWAGDFVGTSLTIAQVPEPSTGLLVMVGLLGIASRSKRA